MADPLTGDRDWRMSVRMLGAAGVDCDDDERQGQDSEEVAALHLWKNVTISESLVDLIYHRASLLSTFPVKLQIASYPENQQYMTTTPSLFERLGGADTVASIACDIVDRHMVNPEINARFANTEEAEIKKLVVDFFTMGTGGPNNYQGRDMVSSHAGMNINEREFIAVLDDALKALDAHNVDSAARGEVLAILYSMKDEVLYQ